MERLTLKDENGWYLTGDGIYSDWGVPEKFRGEDIDRLAAIEDILGDEYDLERLRELVEADRAIKSALSAQKEPEDTYPCTDHECYDRGNYHITCKSQCPYHK